MKKSYYSALILLIIIITFFPLSNLFVVSGGGGGGGGGASAAVSIENPLQAGSFNEFIDKVISFVFMVGIALAPIMFVVAGFYFITAGGDPKRVQTAKQIMLYAAIGLVIILLAKGLVYVLFNIIGAS